MTKRFIVSTALVALVLTALTGCGNHPPTITGVIASPSKVQPGEKASLTCTATDADGDNLAYKWESSIKSGVISENASFNWTAPKDSGTYRFYVTVSDEKGGVAYDSSLSIKVAYKGIGAVTMLAPFDIGTRKAHIMWTSANQSWMGYEIYRSETPGVSAYDKLLTTFTYANGYNRLDTTYEDKQLQPGKKYYYAIQVIDSAGNKVFSEPMTLTTASFEYMGNKQSLGGGHAVRLDIHGSNVFCAAREQGVKIFTIASGGLSGGPAIGHPNGDNSAWAYDLVVSSVNNKDLLHVAYGRGGYMAYDITNSFAPDSQLIQTTTILGGEARTVFVSGSSVFVGCTNPATNTNTLVYFNYSTPGTVFIDTIADIPEDIHVTNNHIYVAVGKSGLQILSFDPSNTTHPIQDVKLFSTYDEVHRVFVAANFAYLAAGDQGAIVVDISNPGNPTESVKWAGDKGSNAQGIQTSSNIVYVADGKYGLRVLNLTDPKYPKHIATKDIKDKVGDFNLMDVVIRTEGTWTQAILADWNNALHMIRW